MDGRRSIETSSEPTYMPNDSQNAEIDQRGHPNYQASMMVAFWKIKMSEIKNAVISVRSLKHSCDKLTGQIHRLKHRHLWKYVPNSEVRKTKLEPSENKPTNTDPNFSKTRCRRSSPATRSSTSASTTRES
jgi:hypothetical protein